MQHQYEGNNTYKITLDSGKELTLTTTEWEELVEGSPVVEDLKKEIQAKNIKEAKVLDLLQ